MPIREAVRLSLEATGNAAFAAGSPRAEAAGARRQGSDLSLTRTGLLPEDFVHILEVAEGADGSTTWLRTRPTTYDDEAGPPSAAAADVGAGYGIWISSAAASSSPSSAVFSST